MRQLEATAWRPKMSVDNNTTRFHAKRQPSVNRHAEHEPSDWWILCLGWGLIMALAAPFMMP